MKTDKQIKREANRIYQWHGQYAVYKYADKLMNKENVNYAPNIDYMFCINCADETPHIGELNGNWECLICGQ